MAGIQGLIFGLRRIRLLDPRLRGNDIGVVSWTGGLARLEPGWCQFEVLELEAWRHGAAHQGPVAERLRRLPRAAWDDALRTLAGGQVVAERQGGSVDAQLE